MTAIYSDDDRWGSSSACRRGCCWTPFGHSVLRDDALVSSLRCHCHEHDPQHPSVFRTRDVVIPAGSMYS